MPDGIRDHEVVSIYPYSDEQIDQLMNAAGECVLMWGTQDGWPVGVYHSFVWKNGKFWITCAAHRHRVAAIRRDGRVSVAVSGVSARSEGSPRGSATAKCRAVVREDRETKDWFYRDLAHKSNPNDKAAEDDFVERLDSPLRIIIEATPEKWITFDGAKSGRDMGEPSRTKSAGRASTRTLSVCAPSANAAASIQTRASRSNQRACRRGGSRHEAGDAAVRKGSKAHRIGGRRQSTLRTSLGPNIAGGPSTQKPVELLRRPLVNHHGDVYDPSVGWGATIIGAERKAIAAKPWTSTRVRRSCGQVLGDECGHPYERPIRSSNRR